MTRTITDADITTLASAEGMLTAVADLYPHQAEQARRLAGELHALLDRLLGTGGRVPVDGGAL